MGRNNSHYDNAPIQTIAQRDDGASHVVPEEGVQLADSDVSIKDFAAGKPNASGDETGSAEADSQNQMTDTRTTPFPELTQTDISSPRKKPPPVTSTTPFVDIPDTSESPVPATRFEVWPPIPGAQRRKGGRGSGRSLARRGTPLRQNLSARANASTTSTPATARRTRSTLAEMVNGETDNPDAEDAALRHEDADEAEDDEPVVKERHDQGAMDAEGDEDAD